MKLGLTSQLVILLATIGVVSSGATGYYTYRANRTMLINEAQQSLLTSTRLLDQRFSSALNEVAEDVLVLAVLPSTQDVAEFVDHAPKDGRERLEQMFMSFMQYHPDYLQVRLISRSHYGLERVRVDRGPSGVIMVPEAGLREKGHFAYVFDTLAIPAGHIYLSPIVINHEAGTHAALGRPIVRVGTPIVGKHGANVGVVIIDVDLTRVFARLARDLPDDDQVYMANQWGDFLIHPNPAFAFGFDRGQRVLMQETFAATKPLFDESSGHVTISDYEHRRNGHVYAFARTPFGVVEGNRFVVLGLTRTISAVLVPADALGGRIMRMVIVFSLFALVLAVLFARALTKPLQTLAHAALRVFDRPPDARLPTERSDEIGILARCFDSMCCEIRLQMSELHSKQRELAHLAGHDALTGLPNRMLFMETLAASIRAAAETGERLAVVFIDLDRFKQINDRFGHWAGDRALVVVAERLTSVLRSSDVAARLGGDEFIVLILDTQSPGVVEEVAMRIAEAMNEDLPLGEERLKVGASIGISEFPADGMTAEDLLLKADAAMYAAKSSGCGMHRCYRELAPPGAVS